MEPSTPGEEHDWLQRLVGDWTVEMDCAMEPGQPRVKYVGKENVRSLGGLWIVADGETGTPGAPDFSASQTTLGFESGTGRFVGSFVSSAMTKFWLYDGFLDDGGDRLVLEATGPSMTGEGEALYRDVHEIAGPDERRLIAYLHADGGWLEFMTARYRRAA